MELATQGSKFTYLFQEDKAPVHTSKWKEQNNIKYLKWPTQSLDLNIVENVWRTI